MESRDHYTDGNPNVKPVNSNGSQPYHLGPNEDNALEKIRTAGSVSISPELFEKIYLSPMNKVKGDIRQTFANPTPIALGGFLLSLTPLSNVLMGWRHSGLLGQAEVGVYWFFGGLLMVIGGLLEFVLGNTFPSVVFTTFGSFWLVFGATLTPYFNAAAAYQPDDPTTAAMNPEFAATFSFFLVYMGLLCFIYLICSLRTNAVFFAIFLLITATFGCLSGSFWQVANGNAPLAMKLQTAGGALAFVVSLLGWYLFTVQMLAAVDFPLNLPVGDLSSIVKGSSERAKTQKSKPRAPGGE